jgi:hypothetical protein
MPVETSTVACKRGLLGIAALVLAAAVALHRLGRVSGSTRTERRSVLPDDAMVPRPSFITDHATTINAPPDQVWPWLTQMGWHRAGWYTPRWVDRLLFPANQPSADRLDPALVHELREGDTIPDGPPRTAWFVVERAEAPVLLTLHSTTHVPPSWRKRFGAGLDWVWTFRLSRVERVGASGSTRLLVRSRGVVRPWWLDLAYRFLIVPADHVMATGMLRGLKRRAESNGPPNIGTKDPAARSAPV